MTSEMKSRQVKTIMTSPVEAVRPRTPVSEVRRLLSESIFHHLPVVAEDGTLVGIVSTTDVLRLSFDAYGVESETMGAVIDRQFKLVDVMSRDLVTVRSTDTVREAARRLTSGAYHSLPVVNEEGKVLGMLTSSDLIEVLLDLLS